MALSVSANQDSKEWQTIVFKLTNAVKIKFSSMENANAKVDLLRFREYADKFPNVAKTNNLMDWPVFANQDLSN